MALTNSSKNAPFQILSQLSADAVSFVPCQSGQPLPMNNCDKRAGNHMVPPQPPPPVMLSQTANQQLPGYIMSCYPFVDTDPNTRIPTSNVLLPPGQNDFQRKFGQIAGIVPQRPASLTVEGTSFHVDVHCPPPVTSTLMAPSMLPTAILNPLQLPVFGPLPPLQAATTAYAQMPAIGPVPPQGYFTVPPAIFSFTGSPQFMYPQAAQTQDAWLATNQAKVEDKTLKSKTKVIVCKDNSSQTDFNDELAQLTLAEKPNTLYIKDPMPQEADSDSGYSSPLHRRNQVSSGIQSVPEASTCKPPPSLSLTCSANIIPQPPPQNSVFTSFTGHNLPYVLPPSYPVPQFQRIGYPSPLPVYGPNRLPLNQSGTCTSFYPNFHINGHRPHFRDKQKAEYSCGGMRRSADAVSMPNSSPTSMSESSCVTQQQPDQKGLITSGAPSSDCNGRLPFEDEDEFPILLSAAGGLVAQGECFGTTHLTYGEILKNPSTQQTSRSRRSSASSSDKRRSNSSFSASSAAIIPGHGTNKDSKSARKKQKRQLLAYQAAEEELAEISLEQQMLKELSTKQQKKQLFAVSESKMPVVPKPVPQPSVTASEGTTQTDSHCSAEVPVPVPDSLPIPVECVSEMTMTEESTDTMLTEESSKMATPLDSTMTAKRGKEREFPNRKKPSSLKRVILKEREAKNRHNLLDDCSSLLPSGAAVNSAQTEGGGLESLPPQVPTSAEMSPVSQMSPINMTPLSGSPAGSAGASPIAGDGALCPGRSSVLSKIHSRRFREYCNQVLDKEIDDCCTELLQDLVRFQDRLYHDDPTKAKSKRRFVLGLREVTKHLKLGKLKCIIISPNLERIQSKGGLDDALNAIIEMSQKQDIPFVFALGRRALGRACAKLVPVSVVGVFSYEGSEENFFKLRDLTQKAREAYAEMVASLEREMAATEPPATHTISTTAGSFEKLFPHLGHSRTPSACSAISFISSILSEPISENYPQSEPETDSRGYEIRVENRKPDLDTVGEGREETVEPESVEKGGTALDEDIDDGHEADTEEDGLYSRQPFNETANSLTRESKEKSKHVSESESRLASDFTSKLDHTTAAGVSVNVNKPEGSSGHLVAGNTELGCSMKGPVQAKMSTSERSERIESWVAESQRVTKQLRELSSEAPSTTVIADEESGEDEEENDDEVDEAASLKTIEDSSSSSSGEYEETTDVPFGSVQVQH